MITSVCGRVGFTVGAIEQLGRVSEPVCLGIRRNPSANEIVPQRNIVDIRDVVEERYVGCGIEQNSVDLLNQICIEIPVMSENAQGRRNALLNSSAAVRGFEPIIHGSLVESSFRLRHPDLANLFGAAAAGVSFPVLLAANVAINPFLMGAALFSKVCGSGGLAEDIGESEAAKILWGALAGEVSRNRLGAWEMAVMAFFPILGQYIPALSGMENVFEKAVELLGDSAPGENLEIQRDIERSAKLGRSVQCWLGAMSESECAEIDVEAWDKWMMDPEHQVWARPLSAVLQKLHDGAPKDRVSGMVSRAFASRMKNVLKILQIDPVPFIPYLSSLGISGLGTCYDRPVLTFLDLEMRAQARQTLLDVESGVKSLQNMLDVSIKRIVFDETFENLASGMQSAASTDPVEAILMAWDAIQIQGYLDLPELPYRRYEVGDLSQEQIAQVIGQVVRVVRQRQNDRDVIYEFLARDDSPVPWKEAGGCSPSNEMRCRLEVLNNRQTALERRPPQRKDDQSQLEFWRSEEFTQWVHELDEILEARKVIERDAIVIKFDEDRNRWLIA